MRSSCADRKTRAARRYVSPRQGRALTQRERETRALCYLIKSTDCPQDLVDQAAREMAALFWTPANLIPAPDRNGDTAANRRLAEAIARKSCGSTRVYDLLGRARPVDSSCDRHKSKDMPMTIEDHHIIRVNHKLIPFRDTFAHRRVPSPTEYNESVSIAKHLLDKLIRLAE
ncbi:MAG: hypothetical protein WCK89_25235 [bacterium]